MEPCEAPNTLLGVLLLQKDKSRSKTCKVTEFPNFLRDYAIREVNALLWISLIVITALLVKKVIKLVKLWNIGRNLPGPPCPFYGHSLLFSGENLIDFLSKSHEKYGSIVRFWLGPTQLLVSVKDPVVIKELLIKAEDKLPSTGRAFQMAFGRSTLFPSFFEKVQKRKESLAVHMNNKLLERANEIPPDVVECVMERISSIMAKGVVDCRSVSQHMAFSILGSILFGKAFLAWSNATVYEELLMKIGKDACFWASYSIPPFWKRGYWRYKCLCTELRYLTQDIIQQCRKNNNFSQLDQKSCNGTKIERETAIDAAFSSNGLMEDDLFLEDLDGHLNGDEPCGNIMGVMFHGCLTTAGLIGNILTMLVMHPEVQDKIYSEIEMVRKKRLSKSEVQNIYEMNFLMATVYESARLLPPGPLLQRCSQTRDLNLNNGITLPAGTILVVPMQLVQMDGSSWGKDATEFNPHRFLSSADEGSYLGPMVPLTGATNEAVDAPLVFNEPSLNDSFLSFGSGTRACVGQKSAILGIATLFASLLQHYEIRLEPGFENHPKPTMSNCVLQLLPSPKIVFAKRKY